jgi:hypothetical protein
MPAFHYVFRFSRGQLPLAHAFGRPWPNRAPKARESRRRGVGCGEGEAFWYIVKAKRDVLLTTKTVIVDVGCDKMKQ